MSGSIFSGRKDVTYDDYKAVLEGCTFCASVGAQRTSTGGVVYGKQNTTDSNIRGWTWTMPAISNQNITLGRSFNAGRRRARHACRHRRRRIL